VRAVVVGLTALLAALSLTASASAGTPARLRVAGTQPLVVLGSSFDPGERVTLTAMTFTGPKRVLAKATRKGAFRASFRLREQPCGRAFMVVARGAAGSHALLRLAGAPCVPPPVD
jgi:hypothetical protein